MLACPELDDSNIDQRPRTRDEIEAAREFDLAEFESVPSVVCFHFKALMAEREIRSRSEI